MLSGARGRALGSYKVCGSVGRSDRSYREGSTTSTRSPSDASTYSNSSSSSSVFFFSFPSLRPRASVFLCLAQAAPPRRLTRRRHLPLPDAGLGAQKLLWPHLPHREDDVGEKQDRLILLYQLPVFPATAGALLLSGAVSVASRRAARGRHLPSTAANIYCTWSACSAADSPPGDAARRLA
jgi:hypothetical protein